MPHPPADGLTHEALERALRTAQAQAHEWLRPYERQVADLETQARRLARALQRSGLTQRQVAVQLQEATELWREIRDLRSACVRFQGGIGGQMLARLEAGRLERAADDGRGSGPLPFGFRLGALVRTEPVESSRGARYAIEIHPEHAAVVRRIYVLRDSGLTPEQIADQLARELLGVVRKTPREVRAGASPEEITRSKVDFLKTSTIRAILAREELYREGIRVWNGIEARVRWPVILEG